MHRRGFTLVEVLVVVCIAAVCGAILLPALNKARARAVKVQIQNNLVTIGVALVTYKNETRGYWPIVSGYVPPASTSTNSTGYDGAVVLCQALLGLGDYDDMDKDGIPQLGFRTQPGGRVYGPYLAPGAFQVRDLGSRGPQDPSPYTGGKSMSMPVLCDSQGNPILYFPASAARPNVRLPGDPPPYVGASDFSRYDVRDNIGLIPSKGPFARPGDATGDPARRVQVMLGDRNANGVLDADEKEVNEAYLLWSAGADGVFGPNNPNDPSSGEKCDDAINFQ
jgi:prepilin-type N-terminal cleavage/methylation domain-containing protein